MVPGDESLTLPACSGAGCEVSSSAALSVSWADAEPLRLYLVQGDVEKTITQIVCDLTATDSTVPASFMMVLAPDPSGSSSRLGIVRPRSTTFMAGNFSVTFLATSSAGKILVVQP
jgi:hypothetical protein